MTTAWVFSGIDALMRARRFERVLRIPSVQDRLRRTSELVADPEYDEFVATFATRDDLYAPGVVPHTALTVLAIQIGMADALLAAGHRPDWITGYSLGDVARTAAARWGSFEDSVHAIREIAGGADAAAGLGGCALVVIRGRATLDGPLLVWLETLGLAVSRLAQRFAHVSGPVAAIAALHRSATARGLRSFPLFDYPCHTPALADTAREIATRLDQLELRAPDVPTYSSSLGRPLAGLDDLRSELGASLANTFDWHAAVQTLAGAHGVHRFVHVGPCGAASRLTRDAGMELEVVDALDLLFEGAEPMLDRNMA